MGRVNRSHPLSSFICNISHAKTEPTHSSSIYGVDAQRWDSDPNIMGAGEIGLRYYGRFRRSRGCEIFSPSLFINTVATGGPDSQDAFTTANRPATHAGILAATADKRLA
jgi:hypothetical protein